jgi:phthiocerol/phenolphthiocerol synthesis type-I polyketide synthase E
MKPNQKYTGLEIAITGIACRFPGAENWRAYWHNLENGVESVRSLTEGELTGLGVDRMKIDHPGFVNAICTLENKDRFDFSFFEYTPHEAGLLNPVHRIFHQCVWEALEDAGYEPERVKGPIGLYAGAGEDLNWKVYSSLKNDGEEIDAFSLSLINNKDNLSSLISYKLNLQGPAFSVNTGCSTSLVAVNLACKGLLLGESKIALAGGISIITQPQTGYIYQEGMIYSADGHCRAFDKDASGTIGSEGAGVVVLKRLADAIKDGDHIYAIIKGSAINNDGNRKVGYTAPSVDGQVDCIRKAHMFAHVEPDTIGYIETHGTGTRLGDPIELEALNTAFNRNRQHRCFIGSVKTNIGHSDAAAGIAGLIKAALSLKYKKIPASLNFSEPNPELNFEDGPFRVNVSLQEWRRRGDMPLRAGVSSFGIGGTNAHAVLEEAVEAENHDSAQSYKILTLSAKSEDSLVRYFDDLKKFLLMEPGICLADMAYTYQFGRRHFNFRKSIACSTLKELTDLLDRGGPGGKIVRCEERNNAVVFMFPGQGSQYPAMGRGLYDREPVFREEMDKGFRIISELTGEDFKGILFPASGRSEEINETRYAQPLIFLVEYALARWLMHMGVTPRYMIGHSIGEYAAACISGVFSFEDAVRLVVMRGSLMYSLPRGTMVSVHITEAEAQEFLSDAVSLAAINSPEQVVLSGDQASMEEVVRRLDESDITYIILRTSHAFHSAMLNPIMAKFRAELDKVSFNKPGIPFISNLTGSFIQEQEAVSPAYWVSHLRETVRYTKGIKTLLAQPQELVYVEVGAGHSLMGLLTHQQEDAPIPMVTNLIRSIKETEDDIKYLAHRIGALWEYGVQIAWEQYYAGEKRNKISLPTYSFEPVRFSVTVNPFEHLPDLIHMTSGRDGEHPATAGEVGTDMKKTPERQAINQQKRPELSTPFVDAETEVEFKLQAIFGKFFGMEKIGVDDNFYELGGDSLKGMILIKRIRKEFSINLSVKDFLEMDSIRKIAFHIDDLKWVAQKASSSSSKTIVI